MVRGEFSSCNANQEEECAGNSDGAKGAGTCALLLSRSLCCERGVSRQSQRVGRFMLLSSVLNAEVERYASVVSAENTNEGVYNQK